MLVEVLDFVSAFVVVLSLWMVQKDRRWWLIYVSTCVVIIPLMAYKGLWGNMLMCVALGITGIKNFLQAKGIEKCQMKK